MLFTSNKIEKKIIVEKNMKQKREKSRKQYLYDENHFE